MEPSSTTAGPSQTPTKIADWRVPFIKYLPNGTRYSNRNENEHLICRSRQYLVVEGKLWRKNAKAEVLMKCIEQEDGIKLLEEIHSGTCGNHAASRTLDGKVFQVGFYWPSTVADVEKLVRHCANCQFSPKEFMCQPMRFRPYQPPGLLCAGAWIWLDPSNQHQVTSSSYSCWLINFPNG
jgi:hypothetical protein